jgi:GntR family transcriptional regulator, transcriptional repressor for pyruvate dehydrogenase complex
MERVRKDISSNVRPTHADVEQAVCAGAASDAERLMREHLTDYVAKLEQHYPKLLDEVIDWTSAGAPTTRRGIMLEVRTITE